VNIVTLLPFILILGVMFMMSRSNKNRQRQALQMRESMQPGMGVRTIGGMYAAVKEIRDDTVLLEVSPGTHALYSKNAIQAVLETEEYERIVHGAPEELSPEDTVVPDDISSLTSEDDSKVDLGKSAADDAEEASEEEPEAAADETESDEDLAETDAQSKESKRKGDTDSK